jgi:hypothetical protein
MLCCTWVWTRSRRWDVHTSRAWAEWREPAFTAAPAWPWRERRAVTDAPRGASVRRCRRPLAPSSGRRAGGGRRLSDLLQGLKGVFGGRGSLAPTVPGDDMGAARRQRARLRPGAVAPRVGRQPGIGGTDAGGSPGAALADPGAWAGGVRVETIARGLEHPWALAFRTAACSPPNGRGGSAPEAANREGK